MSKLQLNPDGSHKISVPMDIVKGKNWQKGADIGFCIVDEYNRPQNGDIFLRFLRNNR